MTRVKWTPASQARPAGESGYSGGRKRPRTDGVRQQQAVGGATGRLGSRQELGGPRCSVVCVGTATHVASAGLEWQHCAPPSTRAVIAGPACE